MIYGNPTKNNIIAIVIPEKKKCAEALNMTIEDLEKDTQNEKLINLIVDDFLKLATEADFNGLEKAKYILIDFEEFTNQNNCLTPTMKIIRKNVEIKYKKRIDDLYEKISVKNG